MKKLILSFLAVITILPSIAQSTWGKATYDVYMKSCIDEASKALDIKKATAYCDCTAQKLEDRYPNAADLSNLKEGEINELAAVCLDEVDNASNSNSSNSNNNANNNNNNSNSSPKPPTPPKPGNKTEIKKSDEHGPTNWSKVSYDAFMNSCVDGAKSSLGEKEAQKYCDCTAYKLQKSHPDENKLGNVSQEEIQKVAAECLNEK